MKWTLTPTNKELTTGLPIQVEISEYVGTPKVRLHGVGELILKPHGKSLRTEFYVKLPGKYHLEVRDAKNQDGLELDIKEHRYLDFTSEFGFFFVLFLFVMGGIVLWTRKIMNA